MVFIGMKNILRFDGRVAVVTGAGSCLGKAYAMLLAERGASVVVNDLGGTRHGEGHSANVADEVVNEITKRGGQAVANYDSVTNGHNIIKTALDRFGRIDILINNAGILRDKSFPKMTRTDWTKVYEVHLEGSFTTTHAAWDQFKKQTYGRIVMTSSSSGLLGNYGQANYAAAKAGLLGLAHTLAKEGFRYNIHTNTIIPVAASRMTEDVLPPDLLIALKPELIAPVVCWLCHDTCTDNGSIIESSAGVATKYQWLRGPGALLRSSLNDKVSLEDVQSKWDQVTNMDRSKGDTPSGVEDMTALYFRALGKMSAANATKLTEFNRKNLIEYDLEETEFRYDTKDAILYALGVGVSVRDSHSLNYLFEKSDTFQVLPTFPVIMGYEALNKVMAAPGLNVDFLKLFHGEQFLQVYRPLPPRAVVRLKPKLVDVLDKITGTLFIIQVEGRDQDGPLFLSEMAIFEAGSGKFGGNRATKELITKPIAAPKREPDATLEFETSIDQAAIFRLSGDQNPLHIHPDFARRGGFPSPILHGLCSFGITARLIVQKYANDDAAQFKAIKVRFSKPVMPGDTLQVDTWLEGSRVYFEGRSKGSSVVALSGGYVNLAKSM